MYGTSGRVLVRRRWQLPTHYVMLYMIHVLPVFCGNVPRIHEIMVLRAVWRQAFVVRPCASITSIASATVIAHGRVSG